MSDISSHARTDMAGHPDVAEMRQRYARLADGPQAIMVDGLVLLTGLYTAISPWVVHFRTSSPELAINNLVLGLALAAIGLGLTLMPERMYRLSWASAAIGIWLAISPWVVTVGHSATRAMIWNNVCAGAVAFVLGIAAAGMVMSVVRTTPRV